MSIGMDILADYGSDTPFKSSFDLYASMRDVRAQIMFALDGNEEWSHYNGTTKVSFPKSIIVFVTNEVMLL